MTGLAPAADGAAPVSPWAAPLEIARATGLPEDEVTAHLERLRNRWQKSVKALTSVREDLGDDPRRPRPRPRIAAARRRPAGQARCQDRRSGRAPAPGRDLRPRRGRDRGAPRVRPDCVPPLTPSGEAAGASAAGSASPLEAPVIVALTDVGEEGAAPAAEDRFIYAEMLGWAATPWRPVTRSRRDRDQAGMRQEPTAERALRLSDTDLVFLAAAASAGAAATLRLELYPRAVRRARGEEPQVGSIAEGALADELVRRVLARFPDLDTANRPTPDTITELLKGLGYDVVGDRTRGSTSRRRPRFRHVRLP